MKQIIFINDVHVGAPNSIHGHESLLMEIKGLQRAHPEATTIDLGDNYDFANARKKDLPGLYKQYEAFLTAVDISIPGNHERWRTVRKFCITNETVISHGDYEKWGIKKANKYRSKAHGASWFKRKFIVPLIEFAEGLGFRKIMSKKFKKNIIALLRETGCKTYICGHCHPKQNETFDLGNGMKAIVLKRGVQMLEIE